MVDLLEVAERVPTDRNAQWMFGLETPPACEPGTTSMGQVPWMASSFRIRVGSRTLRVKLPCASQAELARFMRLLKRDAGGGQFLITPFSQGVTLSTFCLLFAASFVAGMLVRYHPTRWQELVGHAIGDKALVILRESIDLVERELPLVALRSLSRPFPPKLASRAPTEPEPGTVP
jgi:hypothetical protein